MTDDEVVKLANHLTELAPFYQSWSFWISTVIGSASVLFAILAFVEAKAAKTAASEAGATVKIQTITIELTEIAQRLDKLEYNVTFSEARDLLNEISRRLRRLIAPFQSKPDMVESCNNLKEALVTAKNALEEVRPQGDDVEGLPANSVYFATQGHFSNISSLVAEIMGLFEKRTIEVGE